MRKEKRGWKRYNIIKDAQNRLRLKKEIEPIKDMKSFYIQKRKQSNQEQNN